MHGKSPKNLYKFMPAELSQGLHQALGRAYRLYPLWNKATDEELGRHSRPTGYSNGVLKVQVDSPIWAAKLRQQQRSLIQRLRQSDELNLLQEIQVKVVPSERPLGPATQVSRPASAVPDSAQDSIGRTADAVSDEKLKAALKRLQHTTGKLADNN